MSTQAIYAAIAEAEEHGFDHIIFLAQHIYAQPITDALGYPVGCYIPSDLTIELPKGSVFHMMDNDLSRADPIQVEIRYFIFGVPISDYNGSCVASHLIIDTYYGERYQTERSEKEFLEDNRFVEFGRKAVGCSVEIRDAYSPAGYFLVVDGISALDRNAGILHYGDFVSGRLDDNGIVQTDLNWISTPKLIAVPDYSTDVYFLGPGGYSTFIHTNFLTNYSSISGNTELLRYINNTTDYVELSEKNQANIYYNTVYTVEVDRFINSIGHIYTYGNKTGQRVRFC